jgi:polygalacturonase
VSASPVSLAEFSIDPSNVSAAFERAFASGMRSVFVPPGRYLVQKTLRLPSGTHLTAHPDAHIVLADGAARTASDYLLTNDNPREGSQAITLEGGLWDGNNRGNPRPPGLFDDGYTGAMFHFENVRGLVLKNLTLTNAEAYYTRYTRVRDFHIEDLRFDSSNIRPNNDGVHLGGHCSRGVIRNIRGLRPGVTGDDMVPLNADDALQRAEVRGMSNGPIEDIEIENVQAEDCHSFVRLLSVWSPIRNVRITNLSGTCSVSAINADAARGCRVPLFDEKNPPFPDGVGLLENITVDHLRVAKSRANGIALLRLETRLRNFTIRDFQRLRDQDRDPAAPSLSVNHVSPAGLSVV